MAGPTASSGEGAPLLVRGARLVPVGALAPPGPVDVRLAGGRVTEVGPSLRRLPGEEQLAAEGRWLMPGLWDQHVHLGQWAQARRRLDLSGARSAEEALEVLAGHLAGLPAGDGSAVVGYGHRLAAWPRRPTVAELDAVAGDRPVVLVSGDAHNGWLGSAAQRLLGVPPVDGPLEERPWFAVFARLGELPGQAGSEDEAYAAALADAAGRGVVGVVDFEFGQRPGQWPARLERTGARMRVRTAVYPEELGEVVRAGWRTGDALPGGGGLVTMGPLKVISDGSLNTRTAFCREAYADAGPDGHRGRPNYTAGELRALLADAAAHGLEAAVHAIGDAAVGAALDAFEGTGCVGAIEHAQLTTPGDLARMARLGVRAGVQPAHLLDDRDVTDLLWPDRAGRCFALRSMVDAGVTLRLGSDAPVAPLDPWLAVAAAVRRTAGDRPPWHGEESLTPAEALAASTDGRTTVAPGAPADLVLLDDDPLQVAGAAPAVAATLVAGRPAHPTVG